MAATARSIGMFPQYGFLVDEENLAEITQSVASKELSIVKEARAGVNFGIYLSEDAAGTVTITGTYGDYTNEEGYDGTPAAYTTRTIATVDVTAGRKQVLSLNGYEAYYLRAVTVSGGGSSLSAGTAQVSLF